MKEWKEIFQASSNQKRAGLVVLIADKVDLKTEIVKEKKKSIIYSHKWSINLEDLTIINICMYLTTEPQNI